MADFLSRFSLLWLSVSSLFYLILATTQQDNCDINSLLAVQQLCRKCDFAREENSIAKDVCWHSNPASFRPNKKWVQNNRCCVLPNCAIGIDLRNCSIPLSLIKEAGTEMSLNYIIVDKAETCPGGDLQWNKISHLKGAKICRNSQDICANVTCPTNSHCVVNGTGTECLCDAGWHGYKCLRYGTFPAKEWLCSIAAGTLTITFVLWFFQRTSIARIKKRREMMDSLVSSTITQNGPIG